MASVIHYNLSLYDMVAEIDSPKENYASEAQQTMIKTTQLCFNLWINHRAVQYKKAFDEISYTTKSVRVIIKKLSRLIDFIFWNSAVAE